MDNQSKVTEDKLAKLNKLLSLAKSSQHEEARTAAYLACKIINESAFKIVAKIPEAQPNLTANGYSYQDYLNLLAEEKAEKEKRHRRLLEFMYALMPILFAIFSLSVIFLLLVKWIME
jgi:hypothetical protein